MPMMIQSPLLRLGKERQRYTCLIGTCISWEFASGLKEEMGFYLGKKKKNSKKSRGITQRLVTIHKEHGIINVTALKIFFFFYPVSQTSK